VAADSGTTDGPSGHTGWKFYNGLGDQPQGMAYTGADGSLAGRWYLTDHLGSVSAVEDSAGSRTLTLSLDPWGNLEKAKGTEGVGYAYTGKMVDGLLSGSDHGARMLDNRMGMWWGRDPKKQFWNVWATGNSTLNAIDPDGQNEIEAGGATIKFEETGKTVEINSVFKDVYIGENNTRVNSDLAMKSYIENRPLILDPDNALLISGISLGLAFAPAAIVAGEPIAVPLATKVSSVIADRAAQNLASGTVQAYISLSKAGNALVAAKLIQEIGKTPIGRTAYSYIAKAADYGIIASKYLKDPDFATIMIGLREQVSKFSQGIK
jgi:hypothetical protein